MGQRSASERHQMSASRLLLGLSALCRGPAAGPSDCSPLSMFSRRRRLPVPGTPTLTMLFGVHMRQNSAAGGAAAAIE